MPNSEHIHTLHSPARQRRVLRPLLLMLALWVLLMTWFFQHSLARYWQYSWQASYPLQALTQWPAWRWGGDLALAAQNLEARASRTLHAQGERWGQAFYGALGWLPVAAASPASALLPATVAPALTTQQPLPPPPNQAPAASTPAIPVIAAPPPPPAAKAAPARAVKPDTLPLRPTQRVFFVGDSLMQGVAPHMQQTLTRTWKVPSINLSRQSTGLAYPGFFNWPDTVRQTLARHPDIGLVVVLLGANDLRDINNPNGRGVLRFGTPEWEAVYRARIRDMADTITAHGAGLIWLQLPNLRPARMNRAAQTLNQLFASEMQRMGGIYLPTNAVLGMQGDTYTAQAPDPDHPQRMLKVRISDGIHMTPRGYQLVANEALTRIAVQAPRRPASAAP